MMASLALVVKSGGSLVPKATTTGLRHSKIYLPHLPTGNVEVDY